MSTWPPAQIAPHQRLVRYLPVSVLTGDATVDLAKSSTILNSPAGQHDLILPQGTYPGQQVHLLVSARPSADWVVQGTFAGYSYLKLNATAHAVMLEWDGGRWHVIAGVPDESQIAYPMGSDYLVVLDPTSGSTKFSVFDGQYLMTNYTVQPGEERQDYLVFRDAYNQHIIKLSFLNSTYVLTDYTPNENDTILDYVVVRDQATGANIAITVYDGQLTNKDVS